MFDLFIVAVFTGLLSAGAYWAIMITLFRRIKVTLNRVKKIAFSTGVATIIGTAEANSASESAEKILSLLF